MHPVNIEPTNNLGLTNDEISYLNKEPLNLLPKMVLDKKGNLIDSFVSLDKTTNEYIAVKRDSINAPDKINEIQLTDKQKADFKNGKPIQLGTQNFQLDVNSNSSVSEENLKTVQFKSGKYTTNNALMDIALIATGAGALVLIEHLAKMLLRNRELTDHLLAHGTKTLNNQANVLLKTLTKDQEPTNKILNDAIQEIKTNPNIRSTDTNEMLLKNLSEQLKSQNLNEVLKDHKIIAAGSENIQSTKVATGKEALLIKTDDLAQSVKLNQVVGFNKGARITQENQHEKETIKTANELNQKEDLKLELNKLRDSYESKGYFTDQEAAKNAVLTEQFNDMGKENKIAADDQTIPNIGQTENENKEAQHATTKLSTENNKKTNTQEIIRTTEKVTSSFLKR